MNTKTRTLTASALIALSIAPFLHAGEAALLSIVARDGGDDRVEVFACSASGGAEPVSPLSGTRWRAIAPRPIARARPGRRQGIEPLSAGALRGLRVRNEFVLVCYEEIAGSVLVRSGFAALSAGVDGAARVLLAGDGKRFVPEGDVWEISPDARFLASVVDGEAEGHEIVIFDLSGELPLTTLIDLDGGLRIRPKTLRISSAGTIYFGGEIDSKESYFYRLAPGASEAEAIAGPFEETPESAVLAGETIAFLGGDDTELLDVWVASASGLALRITESSGEILPNEGNSEHFAISPDGCHVAFNRVIGNEPELFVQETCAARDASQITRNSHFNPYIDQENWILFFDGSVIFAAGHSPDTTDLFQVPLSSIDGALNLTQTGSALTPPFLAKGTLLIDQLAWAESSFLVSATTPDTPDTGAVPRLTLASPDDGELISTGLSSPSLYVELGDAQYFAAIDGGSGLHGLHVARAGELSLIASSSRAPELLLASPERAVYLVHGTGFVELGSSSAPREIPLEAAIDSAALAIVDERLFALARTGSGESLLIDLSSGERVAVRSPIEGESVTLGFTVSGDSLPPGETRFVRGDANSDSRVDIADVLRILDYLFRGAARPACADAADVDDDGQILITDAVRVLLVLFSAPETRIPPPSPEPGLDPSQDTLDCARGVD